MYEDSAISEASTAEVVEELLRQLVDARFVLTDRDGSVTRWSRPAEQLFGWPAPRMLGRPLPETLRLSSDLPASGGQVETTVRRKDGHEFEVALTLVPVSMSQSLEFNGFLEALEIAAPRGNLMAQLRESHHTVVEWIHTAIEGRAELEEDGLSAGTIVAFRPVGEPPPAPPSDEAPRDEGVALEEMESGAVSSGDADQVIEHTAAELAEARADAQAARAQTAETSARLAELEQAGAGLVSGLSEARSSLDEMRAQVDGLRERLEQTPGTSADQVREEGERVTREAEQGRAERERLRNELEAVRTAVDGIRRDLAGAPAAQEHLRGQVEQTRAKVTALEAAVADESGLAEWVDQVKARIGALEMSLADTGAADSVERAASALRADLSEARGRIEQIEAERAEERERFEQEL